MNVYGATRRKSNLLAYLRVKATPVFTTQIMNFFMTIKRKLFYGEEVQRGGENVEVLHYGAMIFEICLERDDSF